MHKAKKRFKALHMVKQVSRLDVIAAQGGGFFTIDKNSFYFAEQKSLDVTERILLD